MADPIVTVTAGWRSRASDDAELDHLARVRRARASFEATVQPTEREPVAAHRAEVRDLLERASALVVAGGHVGALVRLLRLFAVTAPPTVIAWSAGADGRTSLRSRCCSRMCTDGALPPGSRVIGPDGHVGTLRSPQPFSRTALDSASEPAAEPTSETAR